MKSITLKDLEYALERDPNLTLDLSSGFAGNVSVEDNEVFANDETGETKKVELSDITRINK